MTFISSNPPLSGAAHPNQPPRQRWTPGFEDVFPALPLATQGPKSNELLSESQDLRRVLMGLAENWRVALGQLNDPNSPISVAMHASVGFTGSECLEMFKLHLNPDPKSWRPEIVSGALRLLRAVRMGPPLAPAALLDLALCHQTSGKSAQASYGRDIAACWVVGWPCLDSTTEVKTPTGLSSKFRYGVDGLVGILLSDKEVPLYVTSFLPTGETSVRVIQIQKVRSDLPDAKRGTLKRFDFYSLALDVTLNALSRHPIMVAVDRPTLDNFSQVPGREPSASTINLLNVKHQRALKKCGLVPNGADGQQDRAPNFSEMQGPRAYIISRRYSDAL